MDTPQINSNDNVFLLNTFVIWKRRFRVFYNSGVLVWEKYESKKGKTTVPIQDIIAINPKINDSDTEEQQEIKSNIFTLIYAKQTVNSANANKWRHFSTTFHNSDFRLVYLWIRTLQMALNGLNQTEIVDNLPKSPMPIGIIPAGSTDTVAYCLNGTTDIQTTVLNIILGQVDGLDLSSVSNSSGIMKFYASVMSYGFLGDVAIDSEKFRWMGPRRYDYSGLKKLISNRGYEGEVSMLLAPSDKTPDKGPACLQNCQLCLPDRMIISKSSVINQNDGDIDISSLCDKSHTTNIINGKFFMVNGANISCTCTRSPNGFSKYCHLCDGYIDLVLVRHTTFFNNIRFLLAMSSQSSTISELPHVEIYRTRRFSFRPNGVPPNASQYNIHGSTVPISQDNKQTSIWNCDGEVIHDTDVLVRSHRHLINVYRRGLFNAQESDSDINNSNFNCYGLC